MKSPKSIFFMLKKSGKKTTFPAIKLKSKFALPNSIDIRARTITVERQEDHRLSRFRTHFFGFAKSEGSHLAYT